MRKLIYITVVTIDIFDIERHGAADNNTKFP